MLNDHVAFGEIQNFCQQYFKTINNVCCSNYLFEAGPGILPDETTELIAINNQANNGSNYLDSQNAHDFIFTFSNKINTPGFMAGKLMLEVLKGSPVLKANNKNNFAAVVEAKTADIIKQLLNLPQSFVGEFASSLTLSNVHALKNALCWRRNQTDIDSSGNENLSESLIMTCSVSPHILQALSIAGVEPHTLLKVPSIDRRESVDIERLDHALNENHNKPVIYIANAGATNTADYDDLFAISLLKKKYEFWLHVDACFGSIAACSAKTKDLLTGWECADSITMDPHLWTALPGENGLMFTRAEHTSMRLKSFGEHCPGKTMRPGNQLLHPKEMKKSETLPLWFELVTKGRYGYSKQIERSVFCARKFAELIKASKSFRLVNHTHLNVICFALRNKVVEMSGLSLKRYYAVLSERKKIFLSLVPVADSLALQAVFLNEQITEKQVEFIWEELCATLEFMIANNKKLGDVR